MIGNQSGEHFSTLTLMLFTAGGLGFGVPAAQISRTITATVHSEDSLRGLPWKNFSLKDEIVTLIVHPPGKKECRVPIDAIEEILTVEMDKILPFPALIEPLVLSKGLWGLLPRNGQIFLLVDFARLLQTT